MKRVTLTANQLKLNKNKISSLSQLQIFGGAVGGMTGPSCATISTKCQNFHGTDNGNGHGQTGVNGQCNAGNKNNGGTNIAHSVYCNSIDWC